MEAQEKADDELAITKQVKTAKGRAKVQKITMDETKPSFGRRIEPVIDAALKAKVEAAARAKSRKIVSMGIDLFVFDCLSLIHWNILEICQYCDSHHSRMEHMLL